MTINQVLREIDFNYRNPIKCECYGTVCLKRRVTVYDFFTNHKQPIFVCNGIIRLLVENVEDCYEYGLKLRHVDIIRSFFEKIAIAYHEEKYGMGLFEPLFSKPAPKSIYNIYIRNNILERPYLDKEISLRKCIDIFIEKDESYESTSIKHQIVYQLKDFLKSITGIKKYTTLEMKVAASLNKIKNCYNNDEASILLLDTLLELFELVQQKETFI